MIKNLPTMQETWVQCLDWKDSLEEGMATHCSILAQRIPMDRGNWWAIFNGHFIEFHHCVCLCVCVCVCVCVYFFNMPWSMWDHSSLSRD